MRRHNIEGLFAALALMLTVPVCHAVAEEGGADYGGERVGRVWFIDRRLSLFTLEDGTEFRVTDPRQLLDLREGAWVEVDYTHAADRNVVNYIVPARSDTTEGVEPSSGDSGGVH